MPFNEVIEENNRNAGEKEKQDDLKLMQRRTAVNRKKNHMNEFWRQRDFSLRFSLLSTQFCNRFLCCEDLFHESKNNNNLMPSEKQTFLQVFLIFHGSLANSEWKHVLSYIMNIYSSITALMIFWYDNHVVLVTMPSLLSALKYLCITSTELFLLFF